MRSLTILVIICLTLYSCSYTEDNRFVEVEEPFFDETPENEEEIPTGEIQNIPEILQANDIHWDTLRLPFKLSEGELEKHNSGSELTLKQLNYLTQNFRLNNDGDDYYLKVTEKIYTLKEQSEYEEYVSHLDLGQLKNATVHSYGVIDLDSALILLWNIDYSSFDACPYYVGKELFASYIYKDSVQSSIVLGSENSGGDPPAFGETTFKLLLSNDLKLESISYDRTFEDDVLIDLDSTSYTGFVLE